MKTVDFYEDKSNLEEVVRMGAEMILRGDVIVYPTDTAYGFGCDATNVEALEKIYELKERDENKPLSVVMKDLEMIKKYAQVNKKQEALLQKLLPGPVTVVLKSSGKLPRQITANTGTIGIRIPDYALTKRIAEEIDRPYVSTSVNISGEPPETWGIDIFRKFENYSTQPDLIVDIGKLADEQDKPVVSTVIDLTTKTPTILRKGKLDFREILEILES